MEYVRLLSNLHWDPKLNEFSSLAFKNSSDGSGISVINSQCAVQESKDFCSHVVKYYPVLSDAWLFKFEDEFIIGIESNAKFIPDDSEGDKCHYNLKGIKDKAARSIVKKLKIDDLPKC